MAELTTSTTASRRIFLCADDFGLNEPASHSILALVTAGVVLSTTCLVDGPVAASCAPRLREAAANCALGLHLNFTDGDGSYRPLRLPLFILRSYTLGAMNSSELRAHIQRQCDRFEQLFARRPDFVDGHQHVHQLPRIREALLDVVLARYGAGIAVRCTVPRRPRGLKAALISALGGRAFAGHARDAGLPMNADFAGAYDFSTRIPYHTLMHQWLRAISDCGLVMCHPQLPPAESARTGREAEHIFLASESWQAMRDELNIRIVPFTAAEIRCQVRL
ncbi:MAG: ChbG/HpnK family deacetylase [Acidobacteria bacterium]|nr:ChbG/HpnK family deacetylase [Acidobacteriota bacterium]